MTLQVFNPIDVSTNDNGSTDYKREAAQLLAACVAEIKRVPKQNKKVECGESPLDADNTFLEALNFRHNIKFKIKDYRSGIAILEAPGSVQAEIVLVAMASVVIDRHSDAVSDRLCFELLKSLLRRKLRYDESAIQRMLELVMADSIVSSCLPLLSIMSNVERHVQQCGMSKSIRQQLTKLAKTYLPESFSSDERKTGVRIKALLDAGLVDAKITKPKTVPHVAQNVEQDSPRFEINSGEAWTNALLIELGKLSDKSRNRWHQMLEHCRSAKTSKPTKKFLKRAKAILDSIGFDQFVAVLCPALAEIGQAGESERFNYGGRIQFGEPTQVHEAHVDMLRGLVWSTSLSEDQRLITAIGDVAEKCFQKIREIGPRCPKIGNACLIALSTMASESAVAQLGRLKSRAKHVSTRKQIAKAFVRAAEIAGMSEADLIELGIPSFDMSVPGILSKVFGEFTAEAIIHPNQNPKLTWVHVDGKVQKTVPSAVKSEYADELKAFKKKLKEIEKLLPSVRHRIEQLFLDDRRWTLLEFRRRFLDHPLVGVIARRLIWKIDVCGLPTAMIWHDGQFLDSSDRVIQKLDDDAVVSVWHPMHCSAEDVLQWRRWLERNQICQPFKQAHREVYFLTDAERETRTYSNRFASHIIRQHQFAALCQQRGWRFDLQGEWDSWNAPFIDLPQHCLRVEFLVDQLDELNEITHSLVYTYLATDQVRFLPLADDGSMQILDEPVPLDQVPPLVLSEIMRDIDLFVGVSSVGNDPQWRDQHGEPGHTAYWQQFSFGDLSQTAVTRMQTLQNIVPGLSIEKNCRFLDKFLVVEGKLRTYKIHVGSGNILMSPNDQYLCIVQARGSGSRQTENIFLPFEGDNTLSLILSKAFLLVNDDKIKDRTILNQIRRDRI